jgi:hypothetical protein
MADQDPAAPTPSETGEKTEDAQNLPRADFSAHIYTLAMQALIFLGKQPNPETGKYDRNIDIARYQIDTLEILKEKTKGNLSLEENNLLETLLHSCRMAFVDETGRKA